MPIRPDAILIAATRWLELLPQSGEARARTILSTAPRYGDLTSTQYESALEWLRAVGLLENANPPTPANHRVLIAAIETSDAPWLPNADEFGNDPRLLPDDVVAAANALEIDDATASGYVSAAWGKVDNERRVEVGSAGERALVELLESYTDATVEHVSLWSDGLGYDVLTSLHGVVHHLEVKSTTRLHRVSIYLSRNEFVTSARDDAWRLVILRLHPVDLSLRSIATVSTDWLAEQTPSDRGGFGTWQSCRLDVPRVVLSPGLADLTRFFGESIVDVRHLFAWPSL